MKEKNPYLVPFVIPSVALIICALIMAAAWKSNNQSNQTISVTGSAKKSIVSDFAVLRGTVSVQAPTAEGAFKALKAQVPVLIEFLKQNGFQDSQIQLAAQINSPIFETNSQGVPTSVVKGYAYSQRISVESNDVQKIRQLSLDISSVIERGVYFTVEAPEYYYTKLAQIKIEIQAEAAKDASVRAERIAASTGRSLGPLRNARMGVLQITPENSNEVSDYGVNDVSSIEKEITAVVNASFQIN
jgi:hypothetical protein